MWLLTFIWEVKTHPIKQVLKAYWNPKLSQYPSPKKLVLENCINLPWCTHQSEFRKNLNFLVWKVAKTLKLFEANWKWSLLRFLFFLYAQKWKRILEFGETRNVYQNFYWMILLLQNYSYPLRISLALLHWA